MTRPLPRIMLLAALACATPAHADPAAPETTLPSAPRGAVGVIEVVHPDSALRARPVIDANAPLLVRVIPLGSDRYRLEYIGFLSGEHDLAPLLERADGRPADDLGPLFVRVVSQLPETYGADVFGLKSSDLAVSSHYFVLLAVGAALWLAVPAVLITRRALRKRPPVPASPSPEPTPLEQLRDALRAAQDHELTTAERGRIELLLFQVLVNEQRLSADLLDAVAALRHDPRTSDAVLTVERWLHAGQPIDSHVALSALDAHTGMNAPPQGDAP